VKGAIPSTANTVIPTQRLACAYCDRKERVISFYHPARPMTAFDTGKPAARRDTVDPT
jgi:hypothetical protein